MGKIITLLLLFSFVYLINGQCTDKIAMNYYKRSIYEFSVRLVSRFSWKKDYHFVSSPFSTWTLLAALSTVTEGQHYTELQKLLRFNGHICFKRKYFKSINKVLVPEYKTRLEKISFFFIDENLSVKLNFSNGIHKLGVSNIVVNRVDKPDEAAARINEFVSGGTQGMINDLVTPEDFYAGIMFLVDALYFKAAWKMKFNVKETGVAKFYDDSGRKHIGDVNLMYTVVVANITMVPFIDAQVLELPFSVNKRYVMLFFLPATNSSVSKLTFIMERTSLGAIFKLFRDNGMKSTIIQLPKFKMLSYFDNFKEELQAMGLKTMFDPAAVSNVTVLPLTVSKVKQKVGIEINEEGIGGSAKRVLPVQYRSRPAEFIANKPFTYMLVDKSTEIPLLVGAYTKPSLD